MAEEEEAEEEAGVGVAREDLEDLEEATEACVSVLAVEQSSSEGSSTLGDAAGAGLLVLTLSRMTP